MNDRMDGNGAICDRCRANLAVRGKILPNAHGYEYVCEACLTSAERVTFGLEASK